MDATQLEIDPEVASEQSDIGRFSNHAGLPKDEQTWHAQAPSDLIARWRIEVAAGLRDDNGKLTCANLHDPNAPISEALRISDVLMRPELREWLATPVHKLLRDWKSRQ
jgi:hypothetical protein